MKKSHLTIPGTTSKRASSALIYVQFILGAVTSLFQFIYIIESLEYYRALDKKQKETKEEKAINPY